jgi:hypothetical protein
MARKSFSYQAQERQFRSRRKLEVIFAVSWEVEYTLAVLEREDYQNA